MTDLLHPITAPRETPLLFIGPMSSAVLADLKTMTRRVVKPVGNDEGFVLQDYGDGFWPYRSEDGESGFYRDRQGYDVEERIKCPYGQSGDRIWGKETFFAFGRWETRYSEKKGRDEWHFVDMTMECGHRYHYPVADDTLILGAKGRGGTTPMWWKRPAIFMPRVASRILLEVTAVKVERLQDISEADCVAEGCPGGHGSIPEYPYASTPLEHYHWLWNSINGPGSWEANPWVWAVSFRRIK